MYALNDRLLKCFAAVFPQLAPQAILVASQESVEGWDSIAAVTLLSVIEEEFGVAVDPEEALSFPAIRTALEKHALA